MNRKGKIFLITIMSTITVFIVFITVECIRFNNVHSTKPLIILKETVTEDKIIYNSLGFTVEYKFNAIRKENSDHVHMIAYGGTFKLFDQIMLSAWVS